MHFYITTAHPLSIYTVTVFTFFAIFFFYIWNITFKILAKELFGSFPVHCTNFVKKNSLSNSYYKLETADWAEDELWTWNCKLHTAISILKNTKKKLSLWGSNSQPSRYCTTLYWWDYVELIQFHNLHVTARRSTDETMLNSFNLVFIVLIIDPLWGAKWVKMPLLLLQLFSVYMRHLTYE